MILYYTLVYKGRSYPLQVHLLLGRKHKINGTPPPLLIKRVYFDYRDINEVIDISNQLAVEVNLSIQSAASNLSRHGWLTELPRQVIKGYWVANFLSAFSTLLEKRLNNEIEVLLADVQEV